MLSADGKNTRQNVGVRKNWDEAFRAPGSSDDDELMLDAVQPNAFDREEWRWSLVSRKTKKAGS